MKAVVRRTLERSEHDDEAELGLPSPLPAGEQLLWRGAPDWRVLARRNFHVRKLSVYFAALVVWRAAAVLIDGGTALQAVATLFWTVPLAGMALGLIALMAWLVASNAVYTITDRRVVMRVGVVLTVTFNLPLRRIETARLLARPDGTGDIALVLNPEDRIGYVHLWPHVRPWHFTRTEPMLRGLPDAAPVARLLGEALSRSLVQPLRTVDSRPHMEDNPASAHPPLANAA